MFVKNLHDSPLGISSVGTGDGWSGLGIKMGMLSAGS